MPTFILHKVEYLFQLRSFHLSETLHLFSNHLAFKYFMHNELMFNLNQKSLSFYLHILLILEEKFLILFNLEFIYMKVNVNIVKKYEYAI